MAKNIMNIRTFGDLASAVFVAPKGTTLPTDITTALNVSFVELGWMAEDGIEETQTADQAEFTAWQGSTVVKRKRTKVGKTYKFQCLETNATTNGLAFRGQTPTITGAPGAKVAKTDFKDQAINDDRAWVLSVVDGAVTERHVIPAGDYTLTGSTQYQAGNMKILTFEITVIGEGAYVLTNHPAVTGDTSITSY